MQYNNNNRPKRPVLVEKNPHNNTVPSPRKQTGQRKQTVRQRQTMQQTSHQAMSMANHRGPSIQERAEQHRREQELHQAGHSQAPRSKPQAKQKKTAKKKPMVQVKKNGLINKCFVFNQPGVGAPDYLLIEIFAVLLVIGLVMVFSASSYRSLLESGNVYSYFLTQAVSAVIGIIAATFIIFVNPTIFQKLAPFFLFGVLLLVLFTMFVAGEETLGATRWVTILGVRFTPSELAKPFMIICAADLVKNSPYDVVKSRNNFIVFAMMVVTLACIAIEDLGSALAILGGCFAVFIVAGLSKRWIAGVCAAGLAFVFIYCCLEPYRWQRIFGFLNQANADAADGTAYQLTQSLYAFGSGGLFGVGLGNSGQKLLYLPGMHTDFIYSVIGEELGLVGALLVLGLFLALAWRGFIIATRISDPFKSYLAFGAASILVVQALINMGVAVGVVPVTGITLPFISYGGTSLLVSLAIAGVLLNMSRYADNSKRRPRKKKAND
ncbi:MAG: putative peptidoglycan glycosyltransferase FtsW [Peptococcaceae bacterium]|nr:putative peptidoglycan glycosyltransferase FtsW [Peptococcaceae bacterium]